MLIKRDLEISNVVKLSTERDGPRVVFFSGLHEKVRFLLITTRVRSMRSGWAGNAG